MTKHIEFTTNFDLTCWGEDMNDFPEGIDLKFAKESIYDYFSRSYTIVELLENMVIKKIWFEDDD